MGIKIKIHLEYTLNCSPKVLFNRLSNASGMAEWFADNVSVRGKEYTFVWDDSEQKAEMAICKENKSVRYAWLDNDDYFEFNIHQDELTGDVSLIVTDFTEEGEQKESVDLWNSQIAELKHVLGS